MAVTGGPYGAEVSIDGPGTDAATRASSVTAELNRYDPHGGWTRHDVATVAPQGAYVAKRCPVRAQWDVLAPGEPIPLDDTVVARMAAGDAFEAELVAAIVARFPDAVVAAGEVPDRAAVTVAAMRDGAPLIVAGRLPTDETGRRVGEPDLLVRAGDEAVDGRWRYRPANIKHHRAVGREYDGTAAAVADLEGLLEAPTAAAEEPKAGRRHRDDLLQLAHYHRMLEACGHASPSPAWGAIIGRESRVVWYRLDRPMWRTPSRSQGSKLRTSLEIYDFEFAFRLDVKAVAAAHADDRSVPLLVVPVRIPECGACVWWGVCRPMLEDASDISLLPRLSWRQWAAFREIGVTTLPALAALSLDHQVEGLTAEQVRMFVEDARARIGPADAYLRPGCEAVAVPRADLEVDVDMESVEDGVYLWGAWVTDRAGTGLVAPGYHRFDCFDGSLGEQGAAAAFAAFWSWLGALRRACAARGNSFRAYCWFAAAENGALRSLAPGAGVEDEVEAFIASDEWVDLYAVTREHLLTGFGYSLKEVAPLAGFAWRDDDPGGAQSMLWYARAIDPSTEAAEREALVARLLAYNEDDVRATAAVREWLASTPFPPLP